MTAPSQIVQKLWNYCNILRDDGLSYGDYVEQLTFLLFLKMADEQSRPPFNPPTRQGFGGAGRPSPIPKLVLPGGCLIVRCGQWPFAK